MVKCEICNKSFHNKQALGGHKSTVHSKKIECSSCGKNFTRTTLSLHEKSCKNIPECINCGEKVGRKNNKFCSNKCQRKHQRRNKFNLIENGEILSESWMKKYLIYKTGNNCDKCGWNKVNQYSGNIPIELDHIDGNYENNDLDNLRLLCPNCHSLTKTYKGLNFGNGRSYRNN